MKDSDRTGKYHASVINLLSNLVSCNGEFEAKGPAESTLSSVILNCDIHGKAEKELVSRFREKGGHKPSFAVGTSKQQGNPRGQIHLAQR